MRSAPMSRLIGCRRRCMCCPVPTRSSEGRCRSGIPSTKRRRPRLARSPRRPRAHAPRSARRHRRLRAWFQEILPGSHGPVGGRLDLQRNGDILPAGHRHRSSECRRPRWPCRSTGSRAAVPSTFQPRRTNHDEPCAPLSGNDPPRSAGPPRTSARDGDPTEITPREQGNQRLRNPRDSRFSSGSEVVHDFARWSVAGVWAITAPASSSATARVRVKVACC